MRRPGRSGMIGAYIGGFAKVAFSVVQELLPRHPAVILDVETGHELVGIEVKLAEHGLNDRVGIELAGLFVTVDVQASLQEEVVNGFGFTDHRYL